MFDPLATASPVENEQADWQWIRSSSIIYLSFLSVATTLLNGFALFVICKDPLDCFQTELSKYLKFLVMMNFAIGSVGEPLLAYWHANETMDVRTVSWLFVDGLLLLVLAFAMTELELIRNFDTMYLYQPWFTKRVSRVITVCVWVHVVVFDFIRGISGWEFIYVLNLLLDIVVILIVLIIILIANCKAFEGFGGLQAVTVEDEFFKGTIIITVFLITTALMFLTRTLVHISLIVTDNRSSSIRLVGIILRDIILLKFLLDPLVLIFRVREYREAVRVVCVECGCVDDDEPVDTGLTVRYSRDEGIII